MPAAIEGVTGMTENGEDQADDEQNDPDRDQDRQLRHQKPDHQQNDAEDNHVARLPRRREANIGRHPLAGSHRFERLARGSGHVA